MTAWQDLSRLFRDRSGNFGMMTAILLPVLVGGAGMALDLTNIMMSKTQMQEAADAASLAAATALASGEAADDAAAEALAKKFFIAQMANYLGDDEAAKLAGATAIDAATTTTGTGKNYTVKVGSTYGLPLTPLMGVLGYQTMNIAVSGTSTSGTSNKRGGLSMYLALDRSGSMSFKTEETKPGTCKNYTEENWPNPLDEEDPCHIRKIEALKTASNALLNSLSAIDPNNNLVRTGASSYTDTTQAAKAMDWGTDHVRGYVDALPDKPEGGTNASGAMKRAYEALTSKKDNNGNSLNNESKEHKDKKNNEFQRYILLMTDGKMTGNSSIWKESIDEDVLKQCDAAKSDGITVFTVAFMAPIEGQNLLQNCASSPETYFEPETMAGLIAAFDAIGKKAAKEGTRLTN